MHCASTGSAPSQNASRLFRQHAVLTVSSVFKYAAVCCSMLQCVAVCCSTHSQLTPMFTFWQALCDCVLYTLSKHDLALIYPRYPTMRDKLYRLSAMYACDARAASRGLCPKYLECRMGGKAYTSQIGQVKYRHVYIYMYVYVYIYIYMYTHIYVYI